MDQANAIAEIKAGKNDSYLAGDEPHWYYIFTQAQLYRLFKNTVGEPPPTHVAFKALAEMVAGLGAELPVNTAPLDVLRREGPELVRIGYPADRPVPKNRTYGPKPGKLSWLAQHRVVPKCGLIEPKVYPKPGSVSRLVWDIADEITAESSRLPTSKEMRFRAQCRGLNVSTVAVQFSKWRKAHPGYKAQNEWGSPKTVPNKPE
jgi:hypothetical protein